MVALHYPDTTQPLRTLRYPKMDRAIEGAEDSKDRTLSDRIVDVATVVLISLAAVATAWCGYQAARWSALQALDFSRANAARIDASIVANRADDVRAIEIALFVQYEAAVFRRDDAFAKFLYQRFPPDFRNAVGAWLATKPLTNPKAPPSPFVMPQYRVRIDQGFAIASKRANDFVAGAVKANEISDEYVFLTVLFASVTFLGGIAIKAYYPWHLVLTAVGLVLLIVSFARLIHFPIR
jgi:hypothetical protein